MFTTAVSQRISRVSLTVFRDLLFVGGIAAVTYGIFMLSKPAAWMFAGAAAICVAIMMELATGRGASGN